MGTRRTVIVVRHGEQKLIARRSEDLWQIQAPLKASAGARIVEAAGAIKRIFPVVTKIWSSDTVRTRQTAEQIAAEFGGQNVEVARGLGPSNPEAWTPAWRTTCLVRGLDSERHRLSPAEWLQHLPVLVEREASVVMATIDQIAQTLEPGQCDVAISHTPLISLATWMLQGRSGVIPPGLDYCEALILEFDEDSRLQDFRFSHLS